ncbi:MAG: hypothetical protein Q7K33_00145 [Candidatus Berkelbacteria bacterium]|nr:hypothetical protein [Candidatus Berkelbacteria bacterium]
MFGSMKNWTSSQKRLLAIILGGLVLIGLTWVVMRQTSSTTNTVATDSETVSPTAKKSGGDIADEQDASNPTGSPASGSVDSTGGTTGSSSDNSGTGSSSGSGSTAVASQPALSTVTNSKNFGAVAFDSVTATCPSGTIAVGGGFRAAESTRFFASYLTNNGWYVRAVNGTLSSSNVFVFAQCVDNVPGSISVTTATTTIATTSNGTINKDCPSGSTVVSGGFDNIQNELAITFSAKVDNGWRVNAESEVLGDRTLKVLTNCYSGGSVSVVQTLLTDSVPTGWTWTKAKSCDSGLAIMGGFASKAEAFSSYFNINNSKWTTAVYNRTDDAVNLKAYFYCATF